MAQPYTLGGAHVRVWPSKSLACRTPSPLPQVHHAVLFSGQQVAVKVRGGRAGRYGGGDRAGDKGKERGRGRVWRQEGGERGKGGMGRVHG